MLPVAFISAYRAPNNKIILGASMALPAAAFVDAINYAHEAQGHAVDFAGLRGGWILMKVTLAWDLVLCMITSVITYFLTRNRPIRRRPDLLPELSPGFTQLPHPLSPQ